MVLHQPLSRVLGEELHGDRASASRSQSRVLGEEIHGDRAPASRPQGRVLGEELQGDRASMQQPQGRVFDERGDRDRDELWDASYHGDRELHQQPRCRDLCDRKDKNVGGLPKYQPGESRERSPQDALRSTNPVIPSLPPVNKRNSSIEAADWLVEVKPLIGDISNKASRWWEMTMDRTVEV